MVMLRLVFFIIILLGFSFALTERKLPLELAPAISCSLISVLLFVAGILNFMPVAVVIISVMGIVCACLYVYRIITKKSSMPDKRSLIILCVFLLTIVYFAVLLRGQRFTHYDNFTHWATIVKDMLIVDRLPNFEDRLVTFQSYPPSSAVFIYFFCKIVGDAESCYMLAQVIMELSFILSVTVFLKKHNLVMLLSYMAFIAYSLISTVRISDLLVDALMALAGVALMAVLICFAEKKDIENAMIFAVPVNLFLINVKNSGIFFILIGWIYFLIAFAGQLKNNRKNTINFVGLDVALPLIFMYLWKCHTALVYSAAAATKHSVSAENYSSNYGEKTADDIKLITTEFFKRVFDIHNYQFKTFLAIVLVFVIAIIVEGIKKNNIQKALKQLLAMTGIYVLYLAFVYLVYLFSMSLIEARVITGYDRYVQTVQIFMLGLTLLFVLRDWNEKDIVGVVSVTLCCCFIAFLFRANISDLYKRPVYEFTKRYKLQQLITANEILPEQKYIIYQNETDDDDGYLYYMARFDLWSNDVGLCSQENYTDMTTFFDYAIVWTKDDVADEYFGACGLGDYIMADSYAVKMPKAD